MNYTTSQLETMLRCFNEAVENNGVYPTPHNVPAEYNDDSGTLEAVAEIISARPLLIQKKTGEIEVPATLMLSSKAHELIDLWNSLDLSRLFKNDKRGRELNISGLGVMAGPRDAAPKDPVRGLIQLVALLRQDAILVDTPDGKMIESVCHPFHGERIKFWGTTKKLSKKSKGKEFEGIMLSQDHWQKPFGIYYLDAENDVTNTRWIPHSEQSGKGEKSPTRFVFLKLREAKMLKGELGKAQDKTVLGICGARFAKDGEEFDFLGPGQTRESERQQLFVGFEKAVVDARRIAEEKYEEYFVKAIQKDRVRTHKQIAALFWNFVKQEAYTNYWGRQLEFTDERFLHPSERFLVEGIDIEMKEPKLKAALTTRMTESGKSVHELLELIMSNRKFTIQTA